MTAQIRPNRMEVSDRFPMLGFSVKVDQPNVEAEVVLANEVALFDPQNKARRNANNFYTSRQDGTLVVPRGDGIFVVAPSVLARFVGSEKLFFGLATGHSGNGGLKVDALPREGSPYVSLRGFTGRSLRRDFGRGRAASAPQLEWSGDVARPGTESAKPAAPAQPPQAGSDTAGKSPSATKPGGGAYDDGFGPIPAIPARETAYRDAVAARRQPSRMGITMSSGTTAREALDWIRHTVEQAVNVAGSDVDPPSLYRLDGNSGTFITAWQAVFGITGLLIPTNAFLAAMPTLAHDTGVTLSIGPALDTPLFGGGIGVVLGPDGQVALFGTGEISADFSALSEFASSLKLALQAKMKLGYNSGGIAGFASLGKVAAVNVGEEIVGGAEIWLDRAGNGIGGAVSIGVGLALQLAADDPAARATYRRAPTPPATRRGAPAAAMVVGLEDRQKVQRYARDFIDIFQWTVPASVVSEITARGFSIQTIDDAVGDLNLDFYKVDITRFPSGWDGPKLLAHFMRHINDFIDTDNTEFIPYAPGDAQRLASANPVGTVFKLDIAGPDNAAVVISDVKPRYFSVSTLHTPDTGDHPVSGHRMFGFEPEDGKVVFYTRAADRPTLLPQGFQQLIFKGAEMLWQSMQKGVAAFINGNGGAATIVEPFSERFDPTAVREAFGHFDVVAQGLAVEPAIVRPALPNDPRARAARIGGPFAGRVAEALDLGLEPQSLQALLDTLEAPPFAHPMSARRQAGRPLAKAQATTRSINWDDVELIPQPTEMTCWAAAAAMVIGWRDQVSLTPETVASICSRSTNQGLSPYDRATFAGEIGLQAEPPQSYSVDGFYDLLANRGPLWVSKIAGGGATSGHAVVVTGMYSDGDQHFVRVADPWDRVVGAPGSPGGYATTHATGSRYIMRYEDFQTEYELRIVGDPPTPQILDAGGAGDRTPNTGTATAPQGYAMAVRNGGKTASTARRRAWASALDAGAIATIAGTVVTLLVGNDGDVAWELPQWTGYKHPNDIAPPNPAAYQQQVIALSSWPEAGGTYGKCAIRWYFNGTSLGMVYVERGYGSDTVGWGLRITGTIEDDPRVHARSQMALVPGPPMVAALHVLLTYEFHAPPGVGDPTATSRITLYADGTHEIDNGWVQRSGDPVSDLSQPDAQDVPRTNLPVFAG
ncbi:MAG: papain-like cysteine protease family protein [Betaproteobacteria bacterium]